MIEIGPMFGKKIDGKSVIIGEYISLPCGCTYKIYFCGCIEKITAQGMTIMLMDCLIFYIFI